MKSLNEILNESSGDELLGRMMAEYKVFISTLKSLGFEKAPIGSSTYKPGPNRGKVEELWGIPMRAGKWADIFFAVMYDAKAPWRIIDRDGTESYAKLNDANKALHKRMRTIKEGDWDEDIVNEAVEVDDALAKALKKRGFVEAPVNKFASHFIGIKNLKGKIQHIYGVSTRPRTWINLFFVITGEDNNSAAYEKRVRELEKEGLTTSDAQSAADVEFGVKLKNSLQYAVVYLDGDLKAITYPNFNIALKMLDLKKSEFDKVGFFSEGTEEESDPLGESLAMLEDISEMTDEIYSTLSELDSIDEETRSLIAQLYTALDNAYIAVDEKYDIEVSDDDYDFSDMNEEFDKLEK